MNTAPESTGRVYKCGSKCTNQLMTLAEVQAHSEKFHPETITVQTATPEQMANGLAAMADLRAAFAGRNRKR